MKKCKALDMLGGPINDFEMDEIPSLHQWMRYWLYRIDFEGAVETSIEFSNNKVPKPRSERSLPEAMGF
jgi:hypothetical protein